MAVLGRTPPATLATPGCTLLWREQTIGYRVMSLVRTCCRELACAEEDLRLSLKLNPCAADAVEQTGFLMITRGRALEAMDWLDQRHVSFVDGSLTIAIDAGFLGFDIPGGNGVTIDVEMPALECVGGDVLKISPHNPFYFDAAGARLA